MTDIVSHSTEKMRDWSGNIGENADNYDDMINHLYGLIDEFVGSEEFKGGITQDFHDRVISHKNDFLRYSSTFRECTDYINKAATNIDNDEAELKAQFDRANPLDGGDA
jgi:hypothetical protein